MTDDLSSLPQPVRDAIECMCASPGTYVMTEKRDAECMPIIRTELLRVYHDRDKFMWQVRDTCARAERAEAELAALRARIANAPSLTVSRDAGNATIYGYGLIPETMKGQRVRIVVEE
jgi:hypothetical protein